VPLGTKKVEPEPVLPEDESSNDSDSEISDKEVAATPKSPAEVVSGPPPASSSTSASTRDRISEPTQPPTNSTHSQPTPHLDVSADIRQEKAQTLSLLNTLFGGDDVEDWVGQESLGSDIDVDELTKGDIMLIEEDVDFEVVPSSVPANKPSQELQHNAETSEDESGAELAEEIEVDIPIEAAATKGPASKSTQPTTLKNLFAPREEEGNPLGPLRQYLLISPIFR
jgi:hypothetical protein